MKDEELKKAAEAYAYDRVPNPVVKPMDYEPGIYTEKDKFDFIEESFIEGAQWQEAQGWISVSERKPEKMQRVWCYSSDGIHSYGAAIYNGKHFLFDGTLLSGQLFDKVTDKQIFVTHWQPLYPPLQRVTL